MFVPITEYEFDNLFLCLLEFVAVTEFFAHSRRTCEPEGAPPPSTLAGPIGLTGYFFILSLITINHHSLNAEVINCLSLFIPRFH